MSVYMYIVILSGTCDHLCYFDLMFRIKKYMYAYELK